jgi:mono/diheme cytochrome c family protein
MPITRGSCLLLVVAALSGAATFAACSHCPCPSDNGTGAAAATGTFDQQAERGAAVFAASCSKCHHKGGRAPSLVGPHALPGTPPPGRTLRTMPFWTVGDVQRFVKSNMPPCAARPSEGDAWAVVAHVLKKNGMTPSAPLSAANGDTLPLGR